MRKKERTFFLIALKQTGERHSKEPNKVPMLEWLTASPVVNCPCGKTVLDILDSIFGIISEQKVSKSPEPLENSPGIKAETFDFFDWEGDVLPRTLLVEEIPKPGVLIALEPSASLRGEFLTGAAISIRQSLERSNDDLKKFLSGVDVSFEPMPVCKYDVFISYSSKDTDLAREIENSLRQQKLECFLAEKEIQTGQIWQEQIRQALPISRIVLLLLTPNSVTSRWVMYETGACWALKKNLVPAYMFVDVQNIPELISEYQFRRIETSSDREELVEEVIKLCRGRKYYDVHYKGNP